MEEMAAIPEQSALTIAEKFVVHFVVTFGCLLEVHTDQGRNFDGNLFKSLCTILEVAKTRTTPYHPSSNGQIERFNTVLLRHLHPLCKLIDHHQYIPVTIFTGVEGPQNVKVNSFHGEPCVE
jgi:hypothetical protein